MHNYSDLLRNDEEAFLAYRRELLSLGVFKLPLNLKRCHISYAHTETDIEETLEACETALRRVAACKRT